MGFAKLWLVVVVSGVALRSAEAVEIVPVFIVAGQSNAVGACTNSGELSDALRAVQLNVLYAAPQAQDVNWQPLEPPTQFLQVNSGHGFGPELMLGKTVSDAWGGQRVAQVKFALGDINLYQQWNPDVEDSCYVRMRARVNSALALLPTQQPGLTGKVAGFFWMQGESDASAHRTTAQYQADLTHLIGHVRQDFGDPNLPFVFGLINHSGPVDDDARIRQAQVNVAATVPRTFLVDTDGYARDPNQMTHFSTQGTVDLGIGFGNGYLTIVPEPSCAASMAAGATAVLLAGMGLRCVRNAGIPRSPLTHNDTPTGF